MTNGHGCHVKVRRTLFVVVPAVVGGGKEEGKVFSLFVSRDRQTERLKD